MKTIHLVLSLLLPLQALAQIPEPILRWTFEEGSGIAANEKINDKNYLIFTNWANVERVAGVNNTGLRLDGYTTWVEGSPEIDMPTEAITFSTWIALESYPVGTGSILQISDEAATNGVSLQIDTWGRLRASATMGGTQTIQTTESLIKFEWHHIALVVDAAGGNMKLYLDGQELVSSEFSTSSITYPSSPRVYMGRSALVEQLGLYNLNMLNGILDNIEVYDQVLSEDQIQNIYDDTKPISEADLSIPDTRFTNDPHRPIYHPIPVSAWTNEAHGLIYHNGLYHLFFQKNANGPYLDRINWGHMSSPDLVNWTNLKPILTPQLEPGYDQRGIWAGTSAISDDGTPIIIYTGVDFQRASMNVAIGNEDLDEWVKYENNPVVERAPTTFNTRDFRDPYVWKDEEQDKWYMIVGSGIASAGSGGTVFLYESEDLLDWTYLRRMYSGRPDEDDTGEFWELPVFMKFDSTYVLMVNPAPLPGKPARTLYWTGTFENNRFIPFDTEPTELEIVTRFLAPTILKQSDTSYFSIGIIPNLVNPQFEYDKGWANAFSIPRIWTLRGDTALVQKPLPALEQLRGSKQEFTDVAIEAGKEGFFPEVSGKFLEIKATIDPQEVREFGFYLRRAPDQSEQTQIYYDFNTQRWWVDHARSSTSDLIPKSLSTGRYSMPNDQPFEVQIFMDASMIEIFVNGESSFATRSYPEGEESLGFDMYAKGGTAIASKVEVWQMNRMMTVNLDDQLAKTKQVLLKAYPNPFSTQFQIDYKTPRSGKVELSILDQMGRVVDKSAEEYKAAGEYKWEWNGKGEELEMAAGIYFIRLTIDGVVADTLKLMKY